MFALNVGIMLLIGKRRSLSNLEIKTRKRQQKQEYERQTKAAAGWIPFKLLTSVSPTFKQSVALNLPGTDLTIHLVAARSGDSTKNSFAS